MPIETAANNSTSGAEWHYELNGGRLGPVLHRLDGVVLPIASN